MCEGWVGGGGGAAGSDMISLFFSQTCLSLSEVS